MKNTLELQPGAYYLFESLSSGSSCYFETDQEIEYFKNLFDRYLGKYILSHKMYFSTEGYHILVRIRDRKTIRDHYKKTCLRRGKAIQNIFIKELWRVVSEQMRIFMSVFVKAVNRLRDRQGVLVQSRYKRYYFESREEFERYIQEMEGGKRIDSQRNERYRVEDSFVKGLNWLALRGRKTGDNRLFNGFTNYVVSKLINLTLSHHNPAPS